MNENIDLTKILKNCPEGTKFWSKGQGTVVFLGIDKRRACPLLFDRNAFTKEGYTYWDKECMLVPSPEQQDWRKFEAPWYKNDKNNGKFDPHTLQPFDRVLVKSDDDTTWVATLFSHIIKIHDEVTGNDYLESVTSYCISSFCVPYTDDTKYLVGTTDEAPEYYRYWDK